MPSNIPAHKVKMTFDELIERQAESKYQLRFAEQHNLFRWIEAHTKRLNFLHKIERRLTQQVLMEAGEWPTTTTDG